MSDKFFTTNFNAEEIVKFLNHQSKLFKDLSPLMKVARVFMKYTIDENFETEGSHTGEKWAEWSPLWKKRRSRMGRGNGKILGLYGELRKDIRAKHGKDFAMVGTNKKYAALHNFGGDIKRGGKKIGKMPQREFMRMDKYSKEELQAELYIKAKEFLIEEEIRKRVYGK